MDTEKAQLFQIPSALCYLDTASLSPSFTSVEEAGIKAVKAKSIPHTIPTSDFFEPVNALKKAFAKVIDTDQFERIAMLPSVSYGMASVAQNIKLKPDDEILIIEEQFPSNYYIWERVAKEHQAKLVSIPEPQEKAGKGALWNEAILAAINSKTAVIAMAPLHWVHGTLFDLVAIREKATQHEALLILDGSQAIGALPFSVENIQPDALICAGYKWLFGPYGCAYGYFGPYFDQGVPLEENWTNRKGSEDLSKLTQYEAAYKPLAQRYNVGESGSFIHVQMQLAALKQILQWNPNDLQKHCNNISSDSITKLKEMGCFIEDTHARANHLFGIEIPVGIDTNALKEAFANEQIHVSLRGNFIRVSAHYFNTKEDFERLTRCLASFLKTS